MKIILVIFAAVLFTDAAVFSDNDVDSPLVSYLLAKVQRLESKMMTSQRSFTWDTTSNINPWQNAWDIRPNNIRNTRSTRQAAVKSTKKRAISADCKKCPPTVVTYIRWGNDTCPYGANTIYSGFAAGSHYTHIGAAVDPLCLPPDPKYLKSTPGYQDRGLLYGTEYETSGTPLDHSHNRNMPCALCQVYGRTNKIMIPSHYECPSGWRREYYGYLMAGYYNHKAATQYTCVDEDLGQIPGSGGNTDGRLFYTVEAKCGNFIPCSDKELTCVVCTK